MPLDLKYFPKTIAAVKTELTFLTVVVLIAGGFFIAVAEGRGPQQPIVIWAFALIVSLLVLMVGGRFVYQARRSYIENVNENTSFARVLGEEIYWVLEGSIQNLTIKDQQQCYATLVEAVPKSKHFHSDAQKDFSIALVEIIEERSKKRAPLLAKRTRTAPKAGNVERST